MSNLFVILIYIDPIKYNNANKFLYLKLCKVPVKSYYQKILLFHISNIINFIFLDSVVF